MDHATNPRTHFPSTVYQAKPAQIQFDEYSLYHRQTTSKDNSLLEVKLVFYPQRENDVYQSVALNFEHASPHSQGGKTLHLYWDKGCYGLYNLASPTKKSRLQPDLNTTLTTPLGIHLQKQLYASELISELSLEYMIRLLLLNLLMLHDQCEVLATTHGVGLTPRQVAMVHGLITNQQDTFLPVKALADYLELSPYHFSRMFKKSTGFSPYQYMLKLKMQKALELILTSSESVIQVGLATGFENPGHFSKVFKKFHGATPRQIRKDQSVYPKK